MKLTNIIKWILIGRVAYKLGKEKLSGTLDDWTEKLQNAFSIEISRITKFDVFWEDMRIEIELDLWVKNKTEYNLEKANGFVKLNKLELLYNGTLLGEADLKVFPLNFLPHEKKLIRGVPITLYFNNLQILKEIIENWPDVDLIYRIHFTVSNESMKYEGIYNPNND